MKTINSTDLISDDQTLVGVKDEFGRAIKFYDDGYGPIFAFRNSMGLVGIVRARTWETAWEICEDEFFPEADETISEIRAQYNFTREHKKVIRCAIENSETHPQLKPGEKFASSADYTENGKLTDGIFLRWETIETHSDDENAFLDNAIFQENFGLRPNGPNGSDKLNHGIYSKDLNGESLDLLTERLKNELGLTLEISAE